MEGFEELFKTKAQGPALDLTLSRQKLPQKGPSKISLLEANRAKNLAITLRKAGQGSDIICRAIHTYVQVQSNNMRTPTLMDAVSIRPGNLQDKSDILL